MKRLNGSSSFAGRMLQAAALLLCVCAVSIGESGTAAAANLTSAQFNADLLASPAFKALRSKLAADEAKIAAANARISNYKSRISADEVKIAADEAVISRMETFGHSASAPDALTAAITRATANMRLSGEDANVSFVSAALTDTGFGPCPDMGTHIGDATPNPASTTVVYFKQCPINGDQYIYAVIPGVGAIQVTEKVWFTGVGCTGDRVELDDGELYNSTALMRGIVFRSPDDNSLLMVLAHQAGAVITVHSDFSGSCVNEDTTAAAYTATANDINVTGVPESVPADFIY